LILIKYRLYLQFSKADFTKINYFKEKNTMNTSKTAQIKNSDIPVKLDLPNSDMILVFGILSIGLSFVAGIPGLISAIIALKLSKKPLELYKYAPELYHKNSYGKIQAGKITAYIGIVFSVLVLVVALLFFPIVVALF
jgi:ABC-type antimicrobial peptide transport system permease subunit